MIAEILSDIILTQLKGRSQNHWEQLSYCLLKILDSQDIQNSKKSGLCPLNGAVNAMRNRFAKTALAFNLLNSSTPCSLQKEHLGFTQLLVFQFPTLAEISVHKCTTSEGLVLRTMSAHQNLIDWSSNLLEGHTLELIFNSLYQWRWYSARHHFILAGFTNCFILPGVHCNLRFDQFSPNSLRAQ